MSTVLTITGGRGQGRTRGGAVVRAHAAAGISPLTPLTPFSVLGPALPVRVAEAGAPLPGRPVVAYVVEAATSAASPLVWATLVWGTLDDQLVVSGVVGDSKGGVKEQAAAVVADLGLVDSGMVTDGGYGEPGNVLAITLAAVVTAQ